MSHAEERKEKDCLNCGATVQGRYCHVCGQENIVPHETFGHMVKHFFYDITHFDSKFLDSVKYLVTRPGFLSKEYAMGRRVAYLNPVKMYVFTSAVFFLIFFSLFSVKDVMLDSNERLTSKEMEKVKSVAFAKAKTKEDSSVIGKLVEMVGKDSLKGNDTVGAQGIQIFTTDREADYATLEEYDSIQKTLPANERDNWFMRGVKRKNIDINERYRDDLGKLAKDLGNRFIHMFPYMLFVSLPLYALFLKLLYRRTRKYYFVDHGIFLIHLYIFTFILMLVFFGVRELEAWAGWGWLGWVKAAVIMYGVGYTFRSMQNFYGQGFGKTLAKFILFNILCFISLIFIFLVFIIFVVLRV